jgi:uncharacterized membrane protein YqjE
MTHAVEASEHRRPLLAGALYAFHWLLLVFGILYLLAAFGIVSLGADVDAKIISHPLRDHLITATWIVGCFLAAHFLFFRRPGALALYAVSAFVYLGPNLARYVRACLDDRCPGAAYLVGVGYSFIFFAVVWLLFLVALRSWPPKRRAA